MGLCGPWTSQLGPCSQAPRLGKALVCSSLFIFLSHQIQCNPFVKLVLNSDWQVGRRPTQTSFPSSNLVPEGLCAQMNAILDPLHLSPQKPPLGHHQS